MGLGVCVRGASSSSETAVSCGGLGLSGLGVSRGIAFLLCVLLGSMRSLLSGLLGGVEG